MKKKAILLTKQGSPKLSKASDREALVTKQNAKYTFDSFVVGACNRFAYAVAWDVAEAPAKGYNPLYNGLLQFIYRKQHIVYLVAAELNYF